MRRTIDTLGWIAPPSVSIVNCVRERVRPGAIVLMHVASFSTDSATLSAVIAGDAHPHGYGFATSQRS